MGDAPPAAAGSGADGEAGRLRQFALTSLAIDHPTSVVVLTLILILAGFTSYVQVPRESTPEVVIPNIFVTTAYPGVASNDIEMLVTRPIEEQVSNIADVKIISSTSREGLSRINVEFDVGIDMRDALQQVREKVDLARPSLPEAAHEPHVAEVNTAQFPIMQVNVSGSYSEVRLREVAEALQARIEQIPSVQEARLSGGREREVFVDVDLDKLKLYELTFQEVSNAVRLENVTVPGGAIEVGGFRYLVRVPGDLEATETIANIVIETRDGQPVQISDVATVSFGFRKRESFARLDGAAVISLAVVKRSGENIIETSRAVRAAIDDVAPQFPPETTVKITSDQSGDIEDLVSSLENNIIAGLLLVMSVLMFFLGMRTAPFVGIAIPLSMLLSFIIIRQVGITLNMVVLFSLILSLGMLVDNAIVVIENIYRYRERGYDPISAAKYATGEVATPIIASTATTVAAFIPLAFWPGTIGDFMQYLPLTVIMTLLSSMFVALIILPTLASRLLQPEGATKRRMAPGMRAALLTAAAGTLVAALVVNWLTAVLLVATAVLVTGFNRLVGRPGGHWLINRGLPAIVRRYEAALRWALGHRAVMMTLAAALLIGAALLFGATLVGVEFFPENTPPATVYVQVEAPPGTLVEETDALVRGLEEALRPVTGSADVQSVVTTVGTQLGGGGSGTHLATMAITFIDYEDRERDAFDAIQQIRATADMTVTGAEVAVQVETLSPPTGAPVNLEIAGGDAATLRRLGDTVVGTLQASPVFGKLDGLKSDMGTGRPELVVTVDRRRAALHQLTTYDIGETIRSAINGTVASTFRTGDEEYDIRVRLAEAYREDLDSLGDLVVVAKGGAQIPLSSVAAWDVSRGFGATTRKDLKRVVTISANVRDEYNNNTVLAEVRAILEPFEAALPGGYVMRYTGSQEEQQDSMVFLLGAFLQAGMLIALILISQFDSVTKPIIIISSVVLSTIGVLVGLTVFRMPVVIVMTGVGVISLAGVVVNNAIVLIDYIDILRRRDGMERTEAILRGGTTRLRPVILTAITTILGLVPLSIGLNFDFFGLYGSLQPDIFWGGEQAALWGPMATAVICGLTFATFLTLLLVPVMYSLFDDLDRWAARMFLGRRRADPPEAADGAAAVAGIPGGAESADAVAAPADPKRN